MKRHAYRNSELDEISAIVIYSRGSGSRDFQGEHHYTRFPDLTVRAGKRLPATRRDEGSGGKTQRSKNGES
jgi:hypothetical protein